MYAPNTRKFRKHTKVLLVVPFLFSFIFFGLKPSDTRSWFCLPDLEGIIGSQILEPTHYIYPHRADPYLYNKFKHHSQETVSEQKSKTCLHQALLVKLYVAKVHNTIYHIFLRRIVRKNSCH